MDLALEAPSQTPAETAGSVADVQREVVAEKPMVRMGCDQYRQQLKGTISAERKARVCACLSGQCTVIEDPMVCLGRVDGNPCGARLHGVGCAQLTKGHASLGCFLCADCRVRKMFPG